MPSPIIAERSFEFALRIVKLCERMWEGTRASRRIADQLFDAGTSIGANAEEAEGGRRSQISSLDLRLREKRAAKLCTGFGSQSGRASLASVTWLGNSTKRFS